MNEAEAYWLIADVLKYILIILGILAAVAAIGGLIYIWGGEGKAYRKKWNKVFGERDDLNDEQFYNQYFADKDVSIVVVTELRHILAEELDANLARLDAKDDFSQELLFLGFDSFDSVEAVMRIEEEFGITLSDDEAAGITTFELMVELVWEKIRARDED